MLEVRVLGDFRVSRDGEALPIPGARLRALLVRLALAGGRTVEPAVLIDAIWAEDPPAEAAHALQALVSRLRRALGSAGAVTQGVGGYRLDVDPAGVDALRFEQLARTDPAEALALWDGVPGTVAAVAPAVATRLARIAVEAVVDLADAEVRLGRADAAADRLTALLAEHPAQERAAGLLMDALAAQGRQAEALAVFEDTRRALGVEVGAALRERHLRLLRTEPAAAPTNLPAPVTSFIGREDDLARIETLLATGRLVTVLGPGGAGKTRLAVEAARRHPHPAWLIDLSPVTEPAKVATAVLAGAGLRGGAVFQARIAPEGDELDLLEGRFRGQDTVLLIDNCEHLIDAVAHLTAALLARCPDLRVLATSREPLAIDGENLVPLGSLALPGEDASVEEAGRTAAVRLFADRASAVRADFAVDADTIRIVRALDGLPLALELAAARLRTLTRHELAAGLDDRLRLLTSGHRTAYPRHRTLRAVIAWSWDLLGEHERTVAGRIAVLPGGVTAASATAVCAGTPVPAADVPELLAALVDRSLLQLAPEAGRYRMLETIREYGIETLATPATVWQTAATYFAELVARTEPRLRGPDQLEALRTIRADYDNIVAALRHHDDALRLAVDLTWYWQMFGLSSDAAYWLGEALARSAVRGVERDIAEALLLLNTIATQSPLAADEFEEKRTQLRAFADRLLSRPELPGFRGTLIAVRLASLGETRPAVLQGIADGRDVWAAGLARLFRAQAAENEGDLDQVRTDVDGALERFARAGDRWGLATTLPLRALLRQYDGSVDGALADLDEAKRLAREFGSLSLNDEIFIDLRRVDLHLRLDDTARTTELIAAARERALRSTSPEMAILLDALEARLRVRLGDLGRAHELIESAEVPLASFPGGDHGPALTGAVRGALCLALGDGPGAAKALRRAYAAAVATRDKPVMATVAVAVAGLAGFYGRHREVAVVLGAAARLRGAHDRTDPHIRGLSAEGRAALGDAEFEAAYREGRESNPASAVARVL
ncbi:BTAD domain-containing putative transcriptional regulator [Actinoplanes sp. NPDC051343]|uniref:BTAD domain-containing putative transcriptional regulator n=1 Tax=Actinoplanes sp. NPDC051343 TaxID=3363906 RepID=UPI0037B8E32C